jgi:hypothetical protein
MIHLKVKVMKKFRIYFINFQYYSSNEGDTMEEAKVIAKNAGFESRIEEDGSPTIGFSPIYGFRKL